MILSFKPQFKQSILDGSKIHTIRADKTNRWKVGNTIHFATGVRTSDYNCFNKGVCVGVQKIQIRRCYGKDVRIDGIGLSRGDIKNLAINDGFASVESFFDWFNEDFEGKIIHWTDFKYFYQKDIDDSEYILDNDCPEIIVG